MSHFTAESARERQQALITEEERQAWDVLMACLGQLRLALSGHVLGIDLGVALKIAEARVHDLACQRYQASNRANCSG